MCWGREFLTLLTMLIVVQLLNCQLPFSDYMIMLFVLKQQSSTQRRDKNNKDKHQRDWWLNLVIFCKYAVLAIWTHQVSSTLSYFWPIEIISWVNSWKEAFVYLKFTVCEFWFDGHFFIPCKPTSRYFSKFHLRVCSFPQRSDYSVPVVHAVGFRSLWRNFFLCSFTCEYRFTLLTVSRYISFGPRFSLFHFRAFL